MTVMATEQLEIDWAPLVTPDTTAEATIAERYAAWIAANEWVLRAAERLVSNRLADGHKRVGIKAVFEVIRWEYGNRFTPIKGHQTFKANNDFTSRLARDLIRLHPDWAPAIETRALRAD